MTERDISIGVLGSGRMGRTYAECLTQHTRGARLTAIGGGSRAPGLARDYRVHHAPATDALLGRSDVDALIVATPHGRHLEHVLGASNWPTQPDAQGSSSARLTISTSWSRAALSQR